MPAQPDRTQEARPARTRRCTLRRVAAAAAAALAAVLGIQRH